MVAHLAETEGWFFSDDPGFSELDTTKEKHRWYFEDENGKWRSSTTTTTHRFFVANPDDHPFTFAAVCDALGISKTGLRGALGNWVRLRRAGLQVEIGFYRYRKTSA